MSAKTQYTVRRDYVSQDGEPDTEHLGSFRKEPDAVEFARRKSAIYSGEFAVMRFSLFWNQIDHEYEVVEAQPVTVCIGGEEVEG